MKVNITNKNLYCIVTLLFFSLLLTACDKKTGQTARRIHQARQAIDDMQHFFHPVKPVSAILSEVNLSGVHNPFEERPALIEPISSIAAFLKQPWRSQGYVKYAGQFSSVFICFHSEMLLLSRGNKLFNQRWIVERVNPKRVVFYNPELGRRVSKALAVD